MSCSRLKTLLACTYLGLAQVAPAHRGARMQIRDRLHIQTCYLSGRPMSKAYPVVISSLGLRTLVRAAGILLIGAICTSIAVAASLEEIKKRGYMVVATEDDYPPFEYVGNGKPMGYDHALLAILRKFAGFEVRQEILPWQGILPGVASGRYDAAITAAVITD